MIAQIVTRRFDLRAPYTIAYETISDATNHFVTREDENGNRGSGCAAPAPEVTGESSESSYTALEEFVTAVNRGIPLDNALSGIPGSNPSAGAAAEMAILDLRGSRTGQPLCGLLDEADSTPLADVITRPISVTIGICGVEETVRHARRHLSAGFTILKVKGGHDVEEDIQRLRAIRRAGLEWSESDTAGPGAAAAGIPVSGAARTPVLALDANQGYDLRDVERLSDHQSELELAYLEQPTPRDDHALLVEASTVSSVPVMADETVRSEEDVQRLIDLGGVDLINIKLQKVGGPGAALRIDDLASGAGMPVMLGCMDESALSIAAALHFGEARPNVKWFDLDGHLDLIGDPFERLLALERGMLSLEIRAGLGSDGASTTL